jgi:hypothetical protein
MNVTRLNKPKQILNIERTKRALNDLTLIARGLESGSFIGLSPLVP